WYQGSDGLLGVTAVGESRFRLLRAARRDNGLNVGAIELLEERGAVSLPEDFTPIAEVHEGTRDDLGRLYETLERRDDDAAWVSYRFAEILPIMPEEKQACLEADDPLRRRQSIRKMINIVRGVDVN